MQASLNEHALRRCEELISQADELRIELHHRKTTDTRVLDCGVGCLGGLQAGIGLAEVCLAGLGRVGLLPGRTKLLAVPRVSVATDQPLHACLGAQYAGWQITGNDQDKYFAMGSGPMRASRQKEAVLEHLQIGERPAHAVGVLESNRLPPASVCAAIAAECNVPPDHLTLLVAPTSSMAGTVQVVARSVETALHKMHELGFEMSRVVSGFGSAPLPPVAADDLQGIGRTNDAVLYGGEVTLWVTGDDDSLKQLGPKIPSSASADCGSPFLEIFKRYDHDFYKIDPMLFSPAVVTLMNLDTGNSFRFGQLRTDILAQSFRL